MRMPCPAASLAQLSFLRGARIPRGHTPQHIYDLVYYGLVPQRRAHGLQLASLLFSALLWNIFQTSPNGHVAV
jgi:hypothetical protein